MTDHERARRAIALVIGVLGPNTDDDMIEWIATALLAIAPDEHLPPVPPGLGF